MILVLGANGRTGRLVIEELLADSGTPFTCLHPYFFMQNMDLQLRAAKDTGRLKSAVSAASIAMVDARDIAEVRTNLQASGLPDWHTDIILQFNRAFAEGLGATPHPAVQDILQRAPISFEQYLGTAQAHANATAAPAGDAPPDRVSP